jgi:cell division protein FtsW
MAKRGFFAEQIERNSARFDPLLLGLLTVLVILGLGMLWSASWFRAEQLYGDPTRFVMRQAMWTMVGVAVLVVTAVFPLDIIRKNLPLIVLVTTIVSLLTFVPGVSARYMGARRWIILFNVSFQPSELVKVTMVLYLAHIFARREGDFSQPLQSLLPPFLVIVLLAGIVLAQNDFSTAIFLVLMALTMFFVAGVPLSYFFRMFILIIPLSLILVFTREHRVRRIIAFLRPAHDPSGGGFQILAARRALETGGVWGVGIGQSVRKFGGLPEAQSDFLFAVLAEELGLLGVVAVTLLFVAMAVRGLYLASRQKDWFRSLLVTGMVGSITLQALLNIAVVVGAVPATGIPLPFFSSGGSSLVITFAMVGLMINAAGDPVVSGKTRRFQSMSRSGWEVYRV